MKKTLIALMALAGIACGSTEPAPYTGAALSLWLDEAAATVTDGQKYVLTFTIGEWTAPVDSSGVFFKLNNNFALRHQVGQYVGLGTTSAGPSGDYTSRNETGDSYIDLDTCGEGGAADYSGWFYDSNEYLTGLADLTFSIDSSNSGGTIITMSNGSRTITLQRNGHTGITNLDFTLAGMDISSASVVWGDNNSVITYTAPAAPPVPEPATATLSLLALAGLAARRRRH